MLDRQGEYRTAAGGCATVQDQRHSNSHIVSVGARNRATIRCDARSGYSAIYPAESTGRKERIILTGRESACFKRIDRYPHMNSQPDLVPHLFQPFTLRSITFRNRIGVSP